jgi:tetratricopeptide (TPR) repeat protein
MALAGMLSTGPVRLFAQQQQGGAPAQTGQKNWKDRDEYDLYNSILSDQNPQTKLDKLNQWKTKYPSSEFSDARRILYLTTYAALGQVQNALNQAKEILAADPKDFTSLYWTTLLTPQAPPTPDSLDQGTKAANALLNGGLDTQFASDKKPANVSDEQWKTARRDIEAAAHKTLGWIGMQQKNWDQSEAEFQKSLALNPNDGQIDYWLGTVIASEKKPEKIPTALFYFARAGVYDGQNSLNAQGRQQVIDYVKNQYKNYHGSLDGFDQLQAQAKASPNPPADFKIVSAVDIQKAQIEKENAEMAANPQLAIWKGIKEQLTGAGGQQYFESGMKGALSPELTGKVVSIEPATRPKTVVLAILDGTTPDATLKFETPLPGKVDPGTSLTFSGVAQSYTAEPFMVVFDVDKEHLKGWTGTNPAAPHRAPVRRTAK